jgi:hypothetical protein
MPAVNLVKASSARFKEAIKPMDKTGEAIFSRQRVTFRYKKALDPAFGCFDELRKEETGTIAPRGSGKTLPIFERTTTGSAFRREFSESLKLRFAFPVEK